MWLGFSKHHNDPNPSGNGLALTRYFDAPVYRSKRRSRGGPKNEVRVPRPEVLMGDAALFRMTVASLGFQNRYSSCVFSFEKSDIDASEFNAGNPAAREKAAGVLGLAMANLFPGIPQVFWPPSYVTTHSHAGRVEINVAATRGVRGPDDRVRAFNPNPPGRFSQKWQAVQDLVNLRYGMCDPLDPGRLKLITAKKNWQVKADAQSVRGGEPVPSNPLQPILDQVVAEARAGNISGRAALVGLLNGLGAKSGWRVLTEAKDTVTIGAPGSSLKDRTRLRGILCRHEFSTDLVLASPDSMLRQRNQRQEELREAAGRLQKVHDAEADFNRSRLGLSRWPEVQFSALDWLNGHCDPPIGSIPKFHLVAQQEGTTKQKAVTENGERSNPATRAEIAPFGPRTTGPTLARNGSDPDRNRRPQNSGFGSAWANDRVGRSTRDTVADPGSHPLATQISHIGSLLQAVMSKLTSRTASLLALNAVAKAMPASLLKIYSNCSNKLEDLHDLLVARDHKHAKSTANERNTERTDRAVEFDRTSEVAAVKLVGPGRWGRSKAGGNSGSSAWNGEWVGSGSRGPQADVQRGRGDGSAAESNQFDRRHSSAPGDKAEQYAQQSFETSRLVHSQTLNATPEPDSVAAFLIRIKAIVARTSQTIPTVRLQMAHGNQIGVLVLVGNKSFIEVTKDQVIVLSSEDNVLTGKLVSALRHGLQITPPNHADLKQGMQRNPSGASETASRPNNASVVDSKTTGSNPPKSPTGVVETRTVSTINGQDGKQKTRTFHPGSTDERGQPSQVRGPKIASGIELDAALNSRNLTETERPHSNTAARPITILLRSPQQSAAILSLENVDWGTSQPYVFSAKQLLDEGYRKKLTLAIGTRRVIKCILLASDSGQPEREILEAWDLLKTSCPNFSAFEIAQMDSQGNLVEVTDPQSELDVVAPEQDSDGPGGP